jgi:hypothetical protein
VLPAVQHVSQRGRPKASGRYAAHLEWAPVTSTLGLTNVRVLISVCCLLMCVPARAQPIAAGDPAIGGYFFFAALDRKCPAPDADRAAALERFKLHFIAGVRPLAQSYGAAGAKALQALDDLERNGPPEEELARYESFFAKASREDLAEFCAEAPKHIGERIALENRMRGGPRSQTQGGNR